MNRPITRDVAERLPRDVHVTLHDTRERHDLSFVQDGKTIVVPGLLLPPEPGTPQSCGIGFDPPSYFFTYTTRNQRADDEFVSAVLASVRSQGALASRVLTSEHPVFKGKMFMFLELGPLRLDIKTIARRVVLVKYKKPQPVIPVSP